MPNTQSKKIVPPLNKLGRYEIAAEIGAGAMGKVYKAFDPLIERTVALKTIRMDLKGKQQSDFEARFFREAESAGTLNHSNIVRIFDAGEEQDIAFIAMELLDGERSVFEALEDAFPLAPQGALRALAGAFGFSGDDVDKKCRVLSGGEKARLVMAKMLFDPPNFLVLDEPTNHLDIATKEMLISALADYEGTMLFVSHDRHFLAALSNRVLELTPDGIHDYGGGYTEYVARTGQEAPGLRG